MGHNGRQKKARGVERQAIEGRASETSWAKKKKKKEKKTKNSACEIGHRTIAKTCTSEPP